MLSSFGTNIAIIICIFISVSLLLIVCGFGTSYIPERITEPLVVDSTPTGSPSPSGDGVDDCLSTYVSCDIYDPNSCNTCKDIGIAFYCIRTSSEDDSGVCGTELPSEIETCNFENGGIISIVGNSATNTTEYKCTCNNPVFVGESCNSLNPAICNRAIRMRGSEDITYISGFDEEKYKEIMKAAPSAAPTNSQDNYQTQALKDACNCYFDRTFDDDIPITNGNRGVIINSQGWPVCQAFQDAENADYLLSGMANNVWYNTTYKGLNLDASSTDFTSDQDQYLTDSQREFREKNGWSTCSCTNPVTIDGVSNGNCWYNNDSQYLYYYMSDLTSPTGDITSIDGADQGTLVYDYYYNLNGLDSSENPIAISSIESNQFPAVYCTQNGTTVDSGVCEVRMLTEGQSSGDVCKSDAST